MSRGRLHLHEGQLFQILDQTGYDAANLVARGKLEWARDRMNVLAAEATMTRIGELAVQLPERLQDDTPEIGWRELRAVRNVGIHRFAYDQQQLFQCLKRDVPDILRAVGRWQARNLEPISQRMVSIRQDLGRSR